MLSTQADPKLIEAFDAAISEKSSEKLKAVLDAGLNPNLMYAELLGNGATHIRHILFKAIGTSDIDCLDVLLKAGADPRKAHEDHASALLSAASRGRADMAQRLIDAGDDVNFSIKGEGWSVVHAAASANQVAILQALKNAGATIDVTTRDGRTPLHLCGESEPTVRWLLQEIAHRIDAQDKNGTTALMEVVKVTERKALNVVDAFLERGADLALRSHEGCGSYYPGKTAAEIARMLNHHAVAEKIELFQAALHARDLIGSLRKSLGSVMGGSLS